MKLKDTPEMIEVHRRLQNLEDSRTIHYTTTTTCQVKDPSKDWQGPENEPAVNLKPLSFIKNSKGERMYIKQHSEEVWYKKAEDDARKDFEREQKAFYEHIMFTKEPRSCYVNREKLEQILDFEESIMETYASELPRLVLTKDIVNHQKKIYSCERMITFINKILNDEV